MKPEPLLKESMTVTHLRKLHRQRASQQRLEQVAGGAGHLRHLDERYGITGCVKTNDYSELPPPGRDRPLKTMARSPSRRGRPGTGRSLDDPITGIDVPDHVRAAAQLVCDEFGIYVIDLFSTRQSHDLSRPRCAFVGIVEEVFPDVERRVLGYLLKRVISMIGTYATNHEHFLTQPEYTLKVERIIAAVNERKVEA